MNAVWPLLSGVKPNDPNVAPPFVDPTEVLEGEPQVEEEIIPQEPDSDFLEDFEEPQLLGSLLLQTLLLLLASIGEFLLS